MFQRNPSIVSTQQLGCVKRWLKLDVSLSRMFTVVPEYRSTCKRQCSLYVWITDSQIPCGIGTITTVCKRTGAVELRQHLLLYAFSKPLQVCFEVSTQSAGERRRGGAGGVGAVWTARHGRHPPSPRGIALKFFRFSRPFCPNISGCQPSMAVNHPWLSTIHGCQRSKTCNNCYNRAVLFQFQGLT